MTKLNGSREQLVEELASDNKHESPKESELLQSTLLELLTVRESLALKLAALKAYPKLTKGVKRAHSAVQKQCQLLASELMSVHGPELAAAIVNSELEAAKNTAVTEAWLQLEAKSKNDQRR